MKYILINLLLTVICFDISVCFANQLAYMPIASPLPTAAATTMMKPVDEQEKSLFSLVLSVPLAFYAGTLSRIDGDRCPSYPNCSRYAREAFSLHCGLYGLWMTVDRLIHERTAITRGPFIKKNNRVYVYDTVAENDFWRQTDAATK
jgi:putative component of membrane protein insertase Oxa1/YidC/SpoIIIJ protein YidD